MGIWDLVLIHYHSDQLILLVHPEQLYLYSLINNYTVLENKKSEIRLMRKKKWNDRIENFKKKFNI